MYIQRNRVKLANGKEYTATMLCEKYRIKGDKNPKTRTLLNELQTEIFNLFKINANDMTSVEI